jgi:16S rRNA (guanine(966)-N(2))-methyltransferase RsmD
LGKSDAPVADVRDTEVRIIGGTFRGRRLQYHGDRTVRPMKHRTRESIFNLISMECAGRYAIDLFAGTGALGLEAISRGAVGATLIEKHVPSARIIEANIKSLEIEGRATLLVTSAFLWAKRDLPTAAETNTPWIVFCSPPYVFFEDRQAEMLDLIGRIRDQAPPGTVLLVEADGRFDFNLLLGDAAGAEYQTWDVRSYPPAVVGVRRDRRVAEWKTAAGS